jgi:phospho-N-acetylmuramoyl-pentapeptide-transferase
VGRTILFPFPWGGAWAWAPGCIAFILLFACFLPNAVNITDGMDGLAIGPAMLLTVFLMVLATVAGDDVLAARYHVPALPGQSEQVVLLATVLGASVGFLWFNAPPATIFMGDTGSMALGGLFAVAAVLLRQELLVLIAGGLFVIEGLSTTIQSYVGIALLGRRLFFRAPLHHTWHFRGLGESKIVIRLWILAGLFLSAALVLLQSRVS